MKKKIIIFIAMLVILGGCGDPLTVWLRDHKYSPIMPVTSKQYLADIYRNKDLSGPSLIKLRDVLSETEANDLMKKVEEDVTITDKAGEKTYKIDGNASFVGNVSAELKKNGVKKFKISVKEAKQYEISQLAFRDIVRNKYRERIPDVSLNKKYYIYGLLKVSSLEYELFDKKGTKIEVTPDSKLESVIKAKLGEEWTSEVSSNLTFNEPRFIGYRVEEIEADSQGDPTIKALPKN